MSEIANSEGTSAGAEKPVQENDVKFPPFSEPNDDDFEEDITEEERNYYKNKFADLNDVHSMRLHCSACDRHLGSSTRNESRMRAHPMLRTLVCHTCHTFYNSGEFEKGDDGSELYCRWCGQGGQVYCCSECPHVFCAKCIKRNLGMPKIKEIENTEDWKCFKCNSKCLWDLRAMCWALLRYCDLKNKITYKTEDQQLKEAYQRDCARDYSECCKNKSRRSKDKVEIKNTKKDVDLIKKSVTNVIAKIPSTIQVKKFASINADDSLRDKKPQKRAASPIKPKAPIFIKSPIPIAGCSPNMANTLSMPPLKKIARMPMMTSIRIGQEKKNPQSSFSRIRPKGPMMPIPVIPPQFNGFNNNSFNNMVVNDNINLSLESLTQGLDMAAVVAMANNNNSNTDDDVVCTPDFPLEPLCEVTEDNNDDDVQCITPAPVNPPKIKTPPPLVPRTVNLPELAAENVIQMTENDVTVNTVTGGLKFRVDPQTLSSNKMYRLPDGRIFAINPNPNMPGGYSATIVAVTDTGKNTVPKGTTYTAKLSSIPSTQSSTISKRSSSNDRNRASNTKRRVTKNSKVNRGTGTTSRECDLHVPVEWYRYNLVDAVDALEYSLSRLNKLKRDATTIFLRTRNVEEIKNLHRTLERLLNTSAMRFNEIRGNLNRELKDYLARKASERVSDDDDDVEILPDLDDDPIFIDENSLESTNNDLICNENPEVDLTGVGSSDLNDSTESKIDNDPKVVKDAGDTNIEESFDCDNNSNSGKESTENGDEVAENHEDADDNTESLNKEPVNSEKIDDSNVEPSSDDKKDDEDPETDKPVQINGESRGDDKRHNDTAKDKCSKDDQKILSNYLNNKYAENKKQDSESKTQDADSKTQDADSKTQDADSKIDDIESKTQEAETKKEDAESKTQDAESKIEDAESKTQDASSKTQDAEMSEELIESLLKDDPDDIDKMLNSKAMDVVESV